MVGAKKPEGVGQRYSTYIDELREFFTSRTVHFGTPEDLAPFAQQVAELGPFQEEMGSMVRTIAYQEDTLGRGEFLELITVAVGGTEVDNASPAVQGSLRQIFLFLNAALRQARMDFADREESEASDRGSEQVPFPARASAPFREPEPMPAYAPARPEPPVQPQGGNDVLYRAMSLSAEEEPARKEHAALPVTPRSVNRTSRGPWWAIPVVGLGLAAFGAGIYAGRPVWEHAQAPHGPAAVDESQAAPLSCVAPIAAGATRSGLEERSRWAHNLLEQGLYDAALPELREISRLDPGYPGVKLDESDALLHLKRPEDAREAVDAQIGVSECLAKLPGPALDTYCSTQYASAAVGQCRQQLSHIRQAAELQAALVHLEMGHSVQPDLSTAAAVEELNRETSPAPKPRRAAAVNPQRKSQRLEPLPPATEGDAAQPPLPRTTARQATGKKEGSDGSLRRGEGTDSAYGAYQKPD